MEYDWERFWCPRDKAYHVDFDGFLEDPQRDGGRFYNPDVLLTDELKRFGVAVLLGEPGIGKSHTISQAFAVSAQNNGEKSQSVLFHNLRKYSTDSFLVNDIFQSDAFKKALDSDAEFYLVLDSLDEARLQISNIAPLLIEELKSCPPERMKLRIACRTLPWPASFLEPELRSIWGEQNVGVFELTPLRRADVEEAIKSNGLNSKQFMQEVSDTRSGAFASRPLTLRFLIDTFRRDQSLPQNPVDLYHIGCLGLCEEQSPSRRASGHVGTVEAPVRLVTASRIACVSMVIPPFLGGHISRIH